VVAFGREDPNNSVYVQHLLCKNAALTWHLIDSGNGHICICGRETMGEEVMKALAEVVMTCGVMQPSCAKAYLEKLLCTGRLVHEFWG